MTAEVIQLDFTAQSIRCERCGEVRDYSQWYWTRDGKRKTPCKECVKASLREKQKTRYHNDPEWRTKYNAYQKAYREQHRGRVGAMQKIREQRHKQRHPESAVLKNRRWRERYPEKQLLRGARNRAHVAGLEFALTLEWIAERLATGRCEVTGLPFLPNETPGRCGPFAPSIDRKNSRGGYTPDNCRVVLWGLNMALSEWGWDVYLIIAKAALENAR